MGLKARQKIYLVIAVLCYAGFLFSFVRGINYGILGAGVGMGIFFLFIVMAGLPNPDEEWEEGAEPLIKRKDSDDAAEEETEAERINVNSMIDQLATRREELETAEGKVKERDAKIDRLGRSLEAVRVELEEANHQKGFLEEKIISLEKQLEQADSKLAKSEELGYETILPDVKNDTPQMINLSEAVGEAVASLRKAADAAGIAIRTVSTDESLMVKASPKMIDVLFKNIIDNAIKYMSKEGTLQITISRIEQELFIVMKDNGQGLSAQETEHIFELNFQGTNRISGNGLGLAQARAIVEYYGGMIYARSNVGSGMGIYIHLPSAV